LRVSVHNQLFGPGEAMAKLHPVVTLSEYWRLVRAGRLRVSGEAIVEAKLDGYLAVIVDRKVYTGSGRRAPSWMIKALESTGADYLRSDGKVFFVEVYGRCATPGGYHRRDSACYRAALVDAGRPPAYASNPEEAALLAKTLEYWERLDVADRLGFETPSARRVVLDYPPEPWELREMLTYYKGLEGYVLKLYSSQGHKLPPDYGAKLRGLLEVKVKHHPQLF
jgi:hypothetical protein